LQIVLRTVVGETMQEPKISDELKKMECEPLLPIEKKLVFWSITVGVVLLGLLVWVNRVLFG
jgi:hypothetical protein